MYGQTNVFIFIFIINYKNLVKEGKYYEEEVLSTNTFINSYKDFDKGIEKIQQ